jgi:hypothetical protein
MKERLSGSGAIDSSSSFAASSSVTVVASLALADLGKPTAVKCRSSKGLVQT